MPNPTSPTDTRTYIECAVCGEREVDYLMLMGDDGRPACCVEHLEKPDMQLVRLTGDLPICRDCAKAWGALKLKYDVCTWHDDICYICEEPNPVCTVRDWAWPGGNYPERVRREAEPECFPA